MESATATTRPRLNWVRVGVLLSAALFLLPFVGAIAQTGLYMVAALIFPFALCIPHLLTLARLFGSQERIKRGLEGAGNIAVGGMILWGLLGGALATFAILEGELLAALFVPLLVGVLGIVVHWFIRHSVRATYEALWPQAGAAPRRVLAGIGVAAYFGLIVFWTAVALPGLIHHRPRSNEASAAASLRTINTVAIQYQSEYKNGYPPSLAALTLPADMPPGKEFQPTCASADLIDYVLAGGEKSGYVFTYTPGPPVKEPAAGCPPGAESYTVTARPRVFGETGQRNFFTDQSGVIRATREDRPATAGDPPLS